jgi:hypothetical protein
VSTLLQRELRDAMKRRDDAKTKLRSLEKIRDEAAARAKTVVGELEAARIALKEAAGSSAVGEGSAVDVTAARKRIKTAGENAEVAVAEAEGVGERIAPLEKEIEQHERHVSRAASRICTSLAGEIDHRALEIAADLGRLIELRAALAKYAFLHSNGHDPIGGTAPAFLRNVHRRLGFEVAGELRTIPRIDHIDLEALATMPMVGDEPEAQAAE